MADTPLTFSVLDQFLGVCRFPQDAEIPLWAMEAPFFTVTRTHDELSIVCPEEEIPPGVTVEKGWRALKLEGPFSFEAIGVLARITLPLAEARIPILSLATFDTDYVLVKAERLEAAVRALEAHGLTVRR